jgi:two-component system, OmpR family, phosphate regulon response regulator PhoB
MDKSILIVEDDAFILDTITRRFKKDGFAILLAKDGEQVEEVLKDNLPNLILLDVLLPKMNGLEVLKKIKSDERTKGIPVVMFSNLGSPEDVKHAMELGATDYLVKANLSPNEVVNKVTNLLSK